MRGYWARHTATTWPELCECWQFRRTACLHANGLNALPKGTVILLDHRWREARNAAAVGVPLQLSGNTRGGMVLGLDQLTARANSGYVSGRYDVDGCPYVNNGTGLWLGFALRLGRPSELTRITLRREM